MSGLPPVATVSADIEGRQPWANSGLNGRLRGEWPIEVDRSFWLRDRSGSFLDRLEFEAPNLFGP